MLRSLCGGSPRLVHIADSSMVFSPTLPWSRSNHAGPTFFLIPTQNRSRMIPAPQFAIGVVFCVCVGIPEAKGSVRGCVPCVEARRVLFTIAFFSTF